MNTHLTYELIKDNGTYIETQHKHTTMLLYLSWRVGNRHINPCSSSECFIKAKSDVGKT